MPELRCVLRATARLLVFLLIRKRHQAFDQPHGTATSYCRKSQSSQGFVTPSRRFLGTLSALV